jgi:hypothetical protein
MSFLLLVCRCPPKLLLSHSGENTVVDPKEGKEQGYTDPFSQGLQKNRDDLF